MVRRVDVFKMRRVGGGRIERESTGDVVVRARGLLGVHVGALFGTVDGGMEGRFGDDRCRAAGEVPFHTWSTSGSRPPSAVRVVTVPSGFRICLCQPSYSTLPRKKSRDSL